MRKFSSVLTAAVALCACAALVIAQEVAPPNQAVATSAGAGERNTDENKPAETSGSEKPSNKPGAKPGTVPPRLPSTETEPTPTPKPRRRSFFGWLFGSHRRKDEATPAPVPTPGLPSNTGSTSRRVPRRPASTLAPEESSTPKPGRATPSPKPTPTPKRTDRTPRSPRPETTPNPEKSTPVAKPERVTPATPGPVATPPARRTPKPKATPVPAANAVGESADPEEREKARFEAAKAKAMESPQVKSLKDKADQASTDEESRAALRAYNKELFEKVKKIDPEISDFADQLERAILKRLGE